jgi:hypothetical protein
LLPQARRSWTAGKWRGTHNSAHHLFPRRDRGSGISSDAQAQSHECGVDDRSLSESKGLGLLVLIFGCQHRVVEERHRHQTTFFVSPWAAQPMTLPFSSLPLRCDFLRSMELEMPDKVNESKDFDADLEKFRRIFGSVASLVEDDDSNVLTGTETNQSTFSACWLLWGHLGRG